MIEVLIFIYPSWWELKVIFHLYRQINDRLGFSYSSKFEIMRRKTDVVIFVVEYEYMNDCENTNPLARRYLQPD